MPAMDETAAARLPWGAPSAALGSGSGKEMDFIGLEEFVGFS